MLATVTCAIFLFCSWLMPVMTGEEPKAQRAEALAKYGFDPSTALESRIGEPPAAVLKAIKEREEMQMAASVRKKTGLQNGGDLSVSAETAAAETAAPIEEEIALRAYEIYLERGKTDGYDVDDWLQAEYELRA